MLYHQAVGMSLFGNDSDLISLVERCRRRDGRAWSILVERYSRLVYSIPRRYSLSEDDSADVYQSTFKALCQSIDRIAEPATLPRWLAVTASRLSLRCLRNQNRTVSLECGEGSLTDVIASEDASAESNAIAASQSTILREAVGALKGKCGPLLTMLYLGEEASYQDVCEKLEMPIGAIGPTRARCLEKLRRALEEAGFFT